jgi:hypothetical protein
LSPHAHRQFYPLDLEAVLHLNGFDFESFSGDFNGIPVANDSTTLLIHARARKRK